jgi:hypothetical protein
MSYEQNYNKIMENKIWAFSLFTTNNRGISNWVSSRGVSFGPEPEVFEAKPSLPCDGRYFLES